MNFRAVRALLRFELRQLRRERARLLITAALIALPVASLVFVGAIVTMIEPTADETIYHEIGIADFAVRGIEKQAELEKALGILEPDVVLQPVYRGVDEISVNGRIVSAAVLAIRPVSEADAGLAQGLTGLREGRFPVNSGEVAVSKALARELSLTIGDSVYLAYGADRTIVGLIEDLEDTSAFQLMRIPSWTERGGEHFLLCRLDAGQGDLRVSKLRERGFQVTTIEDIRSGTDGLTIGFVFVSSWIGFFEAALIIGAAHAISIKRRQREFGLIASIGGNPLHVFTSMLTVTFCVSAVASFLGILAGIFFSWLLHPFLDQWNGRINGAFEVSLFFLLSAGTLGVIASLLAVAYPSWKSSRLSVREALLSFRPEPGRARIRWFVGGALTGLSSCLYGIPSLAEAILSSSRLVVVPALFAVGVVLISPFLLGFSHLVCRTGFPIMRLAIRETVRYRGRSSIAVVAVFAAMSISVATAIVTASLQRTLDSFPAKLRDDQILLSGPSAPEVVGQLSRTSDCVAVAPLVAAYFHGQPLRVQCESDVVSSGLQQWIAIGDEDLLQAFGVERGLEEFSKGTVLSLNRDLLSGNPEVRTWVDGTSVAINRFAEVQGAQPISGPLFFIDVNSVPGSELQSGPPPNRGSIPWIVRFSRPIDDTILHEVNELFGGMSGSGIESHRTKSHALSYASVIALALSTFLGVVVVLSTLALNFTESREEFRILISIGAGQGQLRSLIGMRAWYLTVVGCGLAIPSGIIVAASLLEATNFDMRWTVPWGDIVLALLIVPMFVGVCAGMCLRPWKKISVAAAGVQVQS